MPYDLDDFMADKEATEIGTAIEDLFIDKNLAYDPWHPMGGDGKFSSTTVGDIYHEVEVGFVIAPEEVEDNFFGVLFRNYFPRAKQVGDQITKIFNWGTVLLQEQDGETGQWLPPQEVDFVCSNVLSEESTSFLGFRAGEADVQTWNHTDFSGFTQDAVKAGGNADEDFKFHPLRNITALGEAREYQDLQEVYEDEGAMMLPCAAMLYVPRDVDLSQERFKFEIKSKVIFGFTGVD